MEHMLTTIDGYSVEIYVYNSWDYSCHVMIANYPGRRVNSLDPDYGLRGRDEYEVFIHDVPFMTKEEVIRMFNLK